MIVMGIDPGSRVTGYGFVEYRDSRVRCLEYGAINAMLSGGRACPVPIRLKTIYGRLQELITRIQPDTIAVEGVFHAANVKSALTLGHARGIALLAAAQSGAPLVEYSPLEVKRSVVGYGRADKSQVQFMVQKLLGLDSLPQPYDAADALAIALCRIFNGEPPSGRRQKWRSFKPKG